MNKLARNKKKKKYYTYIESAAWKRKRIEKLAIHPRCQICDSIENIQIHHRWYNLNGHSIVGKEVVERDLITFCAECHQKWHDIFKLQETTKGRLEQFLSVRTGIQAKFIEPTIPKKKKKSKLERQINAIKHYVKPVVNTRKSIRRMLDV